MCGNLTLTFTTPHRTSFPLSFLISNKIPKFPISDLPQPQLPPDQNQTQIQNSLSLFISFSLYRSPLQVFSNNGCSSLDQLKLFEAVLSGKERRTLNNKMNDSWSLEEIFNSVSDDIFNDAIKCFDFPLEDLEPNNVSGEEWDAGFHILEPPPPPPPTNALAGFSSSLLHGGCLSDDSDKRVSLSPDQASQLNLRTSVNEASSCRSILLPGNNVDVKYPGLFQTSSPVSVLESSSSCSAENPTPSYSMLNFPVKKGARSNKRRPASALNLQFLLPPIHSSSSASRESCSLGASEVESDNYAEKPAKKKQKKKRHPTLSPSGDESVESTSEQQVGVRKCMHCGITKTPQWREGPMGPKTLCNACGVRYRSGRLLPEYRPAASPTFIPSIHSNSHKKVIELRKKSKLQPHIGFPGTLLPPATCNLA